MQAASGVTAQVGRIKVTLNLAYGIFCKRSNFEAPLDADADNSFEITVLATDGDDPELFGSQDITVTLLDVEELPLDGTVVGSPEADNFQGGVNIEAIADVVLAGAGDDTVDLPFTQSDAAGNFVLAGSGTDTIIVSSNDVIFGGSAADLIDASNGTGGNRVSGGDGDDLFLLGSGGDRFLGGAGADTFVVSADGSSTTNIIAGGSGADFFNILTGDVTLVAAATVITDFAVGTDTLGISNQGDSFDFATQVSLSENNILIDGNPVATLLGVNAADLTIDSFLIV